MTRRRARLPHNDEDPWMCWCRPTRLGPSGRGEWIHYDTPPEQRTQKRRERSHD